MIKNNYLSLNYKDILTSAFKHNWYKNPEANKLDPNMYDSKSVKIKLKLLVNNSKSVNKFWEEHIIFI